MGTWTFVINSLLSFLYLRLLQKLLTLSASKACRPFPTSLTPHFFPALLPAKKPDSCFFPGAQPVYPTAALTQSSFCTKSQPRSAEAPTGMNCGEQNPSLPCLTSREPSWPTASFIALEKSNSSQPLFACRGQYKPGQAAQLSLHSTM